jgi:hypothetical protein
VTDPRQVPPLVGTLLNHRTRQWRRQVLSPLPPPGADRKIRAFSFSGACAQTHVLRAFPARPVTPSYGCNKNIIS